MQDKSYCDRLYSVQDTVLKLIETAETDFYLTGGTSLSRVYLFHRYSDDLDFFVNNSDFFTLYVENITKALKGEYKNNLEIITTADAFVRLSVFDSDVLLKLDFVNDINFHIGDLNSWKNYSKIDNPLNILSNKISALPRNAEKDVADILFLSYHYQFNWESIINDAREKDMWVNPIDVSSLIDTFPVPLFDSIIWITKPDYKKAEKDLKRIAKDILLGADNSLCQK